MNLFPNWRLLRKWDVKQAIDPLLEFNKIGYDRETCDWSGFDWHTKCNYQAPNDRIWNNSQISKKKLCLLCAISNLINNSILKRKFHFHFIITEFFKHYDLRSRDYSQLFTAIHSYSKSNEEKRTQFFCDCFRCHLNINCIETLMSESWWEKIDEISIPCINDEWKKRKQILFAVIENR